MTQTADRNSDMSQIAVNANNIPDDSVDCGIRRLGWCSGASCQKYARVRTFVLVLAFAGILQGACETYFRVSAKEAAAENGFNPIIVEWLLVSSGIFQAIFALFYAHWAYKMHPINWLSGTIALQAAVCVIAMIPSIFNYSDGVVAASAATSSEVCTVAAYQRSTLTAEQSRIVVLVMLFAIQFVLGFGSLAFYTIGLTYLDDNSQSIDSPAVIGTALAGRIFGLQVGALVVLGVNATPVGWWLGWVILGPLLLVSAILIGLYPKRLPKTVIHQAAQRIIEETRSRNFGSQFSTYIDDVNFGPSVKRIFGNKLLMCNLLSIMFIQAANVNFMGQEEAYLQSRFFLPFNEDDGLVQEWEASFVSYFLKPPVAAVGMLVLGLAIAKLKLSGRTIAGINIVFGIHLLAIFVGNIFIKCDVGPIAGVKDGKLQQPYCSRQCANVCQPTTFMPVCPENATVTYFSPCYAGCARKTNINNIEIYEGCSCGSDYEMHSGDGLRATLGACSRDSCLRMLIAFQVLSLTAAALLGATAIGKVIISLRSVLPQDKALALGMEVLLFGLFAYVPTHLAYDVVTRTTCSYWAPEYKRCLLRETPLHGNILNILTASLILVGIFFDVLVFVFAKGLNVYNCKVTDVNYTPSLYSPIPRDDHEQRSDVLPVRAIGGSPATTTTSASPMQRRDSQPTRPAPTPKHEITVFRNPSSLTNSSAGDNSVQEPGVTYAQVVFPPDKHKPNDGTTSPKRLAVRADVPLHHLSAQDVRSQLGNLKSFNVANPNGTTPNGEASANTPLMLDVSAPKTAATLSTLTPTSPPLETDFDEVDRQRPTSPETDF